MSYSTLIDFVTPLLAQLYDLNIMERLAMMTTTVRGLRVGSAINRTILHNGRVTLWTSWGKRWLRDPFYDSHIQMFRITVNVF
jgi:hypothetical protein